jgi:restriction system protein
MFIGSRSRVSPEDYIRPHRATTVWTVPAVRAALNRIDWYQFEKFCAALLQADGFSVTRLGGARPDGGVDLIVEKDGARALIQCKHWRTWDVKENIVREMLGSMTALKVRQGAIYTLKGWTRPAAEFAAQHDITLVNGDELAQSAQSQLSASQLEDLLRPGIHHCPKCEAEMVLRTGDFPSFWGCSRYPQCRGRLNANDEA